MRKIRNGGPAFPTTPDNFERMNPEGTGMTLRDYAIVAMMSAWRQSEGCTPYEDRMSSDCLVQAAAEDVDAMLAERGRNE